MGRIIVPKANLVIPSPVLGMEGRYRLTTKRRDTGWFNNLITDAGLYNIAYFGKQSTSPFIQNYMMVGTGNTAPQVTDISLQNQIASMYYSGIQTLYVPAAGSVPPYWSTIFTYVFPTGAAAGNLSEVGVCPMPIGNGYNISSRALVVDADGNPTTITVLSDEVLTATYELRCYLDTSDHAFNFNFNGSPLTGVYRLANIGQAQIVGKTINASSLWGISTQEIVDITTSPAVASWQNSGSISQIVNDMANSGTWYFDELVTYNAAATALTIKSFVVQAGMWQFQFGNLSSTIPKNVGQVLQASFRQSWGRYTP